MPFSTLPYEIRHVIYPLCFPSREINLCTNQDSSSSDLEFPKNPVTLALNYESRMFTLKHYVFLPHLPEFCTNTKPITSSHDSSASTNDSTTSKDVTTSSHDHLASPSKNGRNSKRSNSKRAPVPGIYIHLSLDTLWCTLSQLTTVLYGTPDPFEALEYAEFGMMRKVHAVYWQFRRLEVRKNEVGMAGLMGKGEDLVGRYTEKGWENGDGREGEVKEGLRWFEGSAWAEEGEEEGV